MSKLPRGLTSEDLCRALKSLGYEITRQELQERLFGR
jgi:predicted RNA binding protein YcfA (HicA-like mRNA interferase family)